jgi:hypothetical protein
MGRRVLEETGGAAVAVVAGAAVVADDAVAAAVVVAIAAVAAARVVEVAAAVAASAWRSFGTSPAVLRNARDFNQDLLSIISSFDRRAKIRFGVDVG